MVVKMLNKCERTDELSEKSNICLLYTSDAADDWLVV